MPGKRVENDGVDWIEEYKKKDALMTERGYPEIPPKEFYRDFSGWILATVRR